MNTAVLLNPETITQRLRGETDAHHAIAELRGGCALPDLLHSRLLILQELREPERVRAYLRTIQKSLEAVL